VTSQRGRQVKKPAVLVYLAGLGSTDRSSGTNIAHVLARSASDLRSGTYAVEVQEATGQPKPPAVIKAPTRKTVLEVREVDYQSSLSGIDGTPSVFRAGLYAVAALLRLLRALRSKAKSPAAKLQLAWGCVLVLSLFGAFVIGILALIQVAYPDMLPSFMSADSTTTKAIWGVGGFSLAALFIFARKKILLAARLARDLMHYCRLGARHDSAVERLIAVIDGIRDADEQREIHLLGYSMGAMVALDSLLPSANAPAIGEHRRSVSSLTTVGCPVDVIRLYYPDYFSGRRAVQPNISWRNLFLPNDVLGSNLLDNSDRKEFEDNTDAFCIAGVKPLESIAANNESLSWLDYVALEGFVTHIRYWGTPDEANYLTRYLDLWMPV
jgi:pimeloyl-ACP methyl ester carboxylesterase